MADAPRAPEAYQQFVGRFPKLEQAWALIAEASQEGPLDARTLRLVKLAAAIGAQRQGAVTAGTRKALCEGIDFELIEQVIAATAGSIGMPATVAAYSWAADARDSLSKT